MTSRSLTLTGLDAGNSTNRLESIKYDLTLRRAQAKKQKAQGKEVGGRVLAKIDAFLGWANVALRIAETKAEKRRRPKTS